MDLQMQTTTYNMADLTWLHRIDGVFENASSGTIATGALIKATHYPDGYVKPGLLLATANGGAYDGMYVPFIEDSAAGFDYETATAVVLDGFRVRQDDDGVVVGAGVGGAVAVAGWPLQVKVGKMPGTLLADGTTAHVIVAADLPANFISIGI